MQLEYKTLEPPKICDSCLSKNVEYLHVDRLGWIQYNDWPYIYFCRACRASVGCHYGTNKPLGKMADSKTRRLRAIAHESFDKLWFAGHFNRSELYQKLAEFLHIEHFNCHFSQLDENQLYASIEWSKTYYFENIEVVQRRIVKLKNARIKRTVRTKTQIEIRKRR